MTVPLEGKRVLITGAAAGIGLGIARACAKAGASLIVTDINYEKLVESSNSIANDASRVHPFKLDISSRSGIREFFETSAQCDERIDGVVNNAGVTIEGDFLEFTEDDLERLWTINLRSVFLVCQQAARLMKKNGGGAIVNVSSNHSVATIPGYEMYAATKGGVSAMTRAMSWSLGPSGIRVNTLSPGLTRTEEVANVVAQKPQLAESFGAMHASGRYASVDEIADIAVFLLSDQAAALTGAEIVADHGSSALLCRSSDIK